MKVKLIQSVKFKKDYMMGLAFLLFFLIVAAELVLIVWLPWHVKVDGMWARQVARLEVIERFDLVRSRARSLSEKLPKPAGAEAMMICRSLDRAAAYMHKKGKNMEPGQCQMFMDILNREYSQLGVIGANKPYSSSVDLDKKKYLGSLRGIKEKRTKK